ncbi:MAG: hypothetical protein ACOH10_08175 [Rhodoglobus sp.]
MDINPLVINALGFAATSFSILMWLPQARTTWQSRNDAVRLAGISETTQWLLVGGYLLWGVYGLLSESFWVAAPSIVALPVAMTTIVVIHRGRKLPETTRSVPILSLSETVSMAPVTAATPIISTHTEVGVGEPITDEKNPTTSTIRILV